MHITQSKTSSSVHVCIDDFPLEQMDTYNYLGSQIDNHLDFSKLFTETICILNYTLYVFKLIRPSLMLSAAKTVFKAQFIPYLDYISLPSFSFSKSNEKTSNHSK